MANQEARRDAVEEVMTAVMSGKIGAIARHFYPGAVVSQRSNAALSGEPWFERMEGEFQLRGEGETRAFIDRRIDGVMRIEGAKARLKKLPGAQAVTDLAFGWIRAPRPRDLPGRTRP